MPKESDPAWNHCKKAYNILNGIICNFCDKVINGGGISKTLEVEVIHREMRSHEIDIEGSNVVSTPPHGELMRQQLVFPLLGEKEDEYNVEGDLATQ